MIGLINCLCTTLELKYLYCGHHGGLCTDKGGMIPWKLSVFSILTFILLLLMLVILLSISINVGACHNILFFCQEVANFSNLSGCNCQNINYGKELMLYSESAIKTVQNNPTQIY